MRIGAICAGVAMGVLAAAGPASADNLVYSSLVGAKHPTNAIGLTRYFERVTAATNGSLTFELFPGGTLASGKETLHAIQTGSVDMGLLADVYTPTDLPVSAMLSDLAVFGSDARVMTGAVNQTLLLDCPACKEDYLDNKVLPLASYSLTPYHLMCTKEAVTSKEGWAGKKIRGTGAMGVLAAAMGGTPVNVTSAEIYEALQRGQADCALGPMPWLQSYSLWDMIKFVSSASLGTYHGTNFINIRMAAWDKLSAAEKKAMVDNLADAVRTMAEVYENDDNTIRGEAEGKGIKWVAPDKSYTDALAAHRKTEVARIVELAKSRGVATPEPIIDQFTRNIEKWEAIVAGIGSGVWNTAQWDAYQAKLQSEIFDKVAHN